MLSVEDAREATYKPSKSQTAAEHKKATKDLKIDRSKKKGFWGRMFGKK